MFLCVEEFGYKLPFFKVSQEEGLYLKNLGEELRVCQNKLQDPMNS